MNAHTVLFSGEPPLFKNQLDLITQLLDNNQSPYYINDSDKTHYNRELSRLKTYLSQLLSTKSQVSRSITDDFKKGLKVVLSEKMDVDTADEIVMQVVDYIKEKKTALINADIKSSIYDELKSNFSAGNYVVVITSRPIDIYSNINYPKFSLREILLEDFLTSLTDSEKDFKNYRFNFPLETLAYTFWMGLRRLLATYLHKNINKNKEELFERLYQKFTLKPSTITEIEGNKNFIKEHIEDIVNEIILSLNKKKHIVVFVCTAPIYSVPIIAINPDETRNSKLYCLLEDEKQQVDIYSYQPEDITLWRIFVWDKLRNQSYAGEEVVYNIDMR